MGAFKCFNAYASRCLTGEARSELVRETSLPSVLGLARSLGISRTAPVMGLPCSSDGEQENPDRETRKKGVRETGG